MRDIDVRNAVRTRLWHDHADEPDARLVEEMGVWSGSVRIDMAVINGELTGFELKSDSDTLKRLPLQRELYGKVFDRVTLVVGEKHWKKAAPIVPDWWGLWLARTSGEETKLIRKRAAKRNPAQDPFVLAQMLWKDEALSLLASRDLAKGWRSRSASDICKRIAAEIPMRQLRAHVRASLKARPTLGQVMPRDLNVPIHV